jgi:hypothetical protein
LWMMTLTRLMMNRREKTANTSAHRLTCRGSTIDVRDALLAVMRLLTYSLVDRNAYGDASKDAGIAPTKASLEPYQGRGAKSYSGKKKCGNKPYANSKSRAGVTKKRSSAGSRSSNGKASSSKTPFNVRGSGNETRARGRSVNGGGRIGMMPT